MATRRAVPVLPPQQQLQRLQEWLRERLSAEPGAPDRKKQRKRRLDSIEAAARKLAELLADEMGERLMAELYRKGSDMRARLLLELADEASAMRAALASERERAPQAEAAQLYLHLLHLNGSRWPSMSGNDVHTSREVECFRAVLEAAGHALEPDSARQLLTRQREAFQRFDVPPMVVEWISAGQNAARLRS